MGGEVGVRITNMRHHKEYHHCFSYHLNSDFFFFSFFDNSIVTIKGEGGFKP